MVLRMPQRDDPAHVHCAVRYGEDCERNRLDLGKGKLYRISRPFASDFRLLRAFVIGRLKRLEEINPPVNECVRAVCGLLSDVLTPAWSKKVLRAIGYSVRSLGTDVLVETLRKAVKVDSSGFPFFHYFTSATQWVCMASLGDAAIVGCYGPGSSNRSSVTRGQVSGGIWLLSKNECGVRFLVSDHEDGISLSLLLVCFKCCPSTEKQWYCHPQHALWERGSKNQRNWN